MIDVQLSRQTEHSVDWLVSSAAMLIDPLQTTNCVSLQSETSQPATETQGRPVEPVL